MKINIKEWVKQEKEKLAEKLGKKTFKPSLLILQMGDNPASNSYIKGKMADAAQCGIEAILFKTNNFAQMLSFVKNNHSYYDGIILQEPCGLEESQRNLILSYISELQDVDGFKQNSCHPACTPMGIISIIKTFYPETDLHGVTVAVVGRGELVGKPLIPMLVSEGCTVISCNSKTKNMAEMLKMADIVVSAVGKNNLITRDMLKDGVFVVDAGITFDENGKLCGDCDKAMYDDDTIAITTVPGGVGLTTRLSLMVNVVNAADFMKRNNYYDYYEEKDNIF